MFEIVDFKNASDWSIEDVSDWLISKQYGSYIDIFRKERINGRALILLTDDDLKLLVKSMGDRKNISFHIKTLKMAYCSNNMPVSRQNSITPIDSIHNVSGHICESCLKKTDTSNDPAKDLINVTRNLKSEKFKTLLSIFYLFVCSLWTAFMLTVVHDRVPDMQKYPPLPDIILGNYFRMKKNED